MIKTFESPVGLGDTIYYLEKIGYDKFRVGEGIVNKACFTSRTISFGIKGKEGLFVMGSRSSIYKKELEIQKDIYERKYIFDQYYNKNNKVDLEMYKSYIEAEIEYKIYTALNLRSESTPRIYIQNRFNVDLIKENDKINLYIKLRVSNKKEAIALSKEIKKLLHKLSKIDNKNIEFI